MTTEIHLEPADYDGHSGVDAGRDHEKCAIFFVSVVVDGHHSCEASYGDTDRDERECESVSQQIGESRYEHREAECHSPWWNGV